MISAVINYIRDIILICISCTFVMVIHILSYGGGKGNGSRDAFSESR